MSTFRSHHSRFAAGYAVAFAALLAIGFGCRGPEGPAGPPGSPGPTGSPGGTPYPAAGDGVVLTLTTANAAADGTVTVDFTLTDAAGAPRPASDVTISWTVAALGFDATWSASEWTNYITRAATGAFGTTDQPTSEKDGTYVDLGGGVWEYTFSHALPAGFDMSALHRVGAWATMTLDDGTEESDDSTIDFRPDGQAASPARDLVTTDACNTCHNPISAHGGYRKKAKLCETCHTPQLADPDTVDPATLTDVTQAMNPLNFSKMVHRIHRGVELPSLQAASAAGVTGPKYSVKGYMGHETVFAEVVADGPDSGTLPDIDGIEFPQALENCTTCHTGGAQSDAWMNQAPTRASCTSCHDTTWFGDPLSPPPRMVPHPGGPFADDTQCAGTCHPAAMSTEFDISVEGAHVNPAHSSQLRGLDVAIVSVTNAAPGSNPKVTFTVKNHDDGSVLTSLAALSSISANMNGPTSDYLYENLVNLNLKTNAVFDATSGTWSASFANRSGSDAWYPGAAALNTNATGTWAVGIEARRTVALSNGSNVTEGAFNPVAYFSVDGSPVAPRRQVVDETNCLKCHDVLALHGGQRKNTEYCVFCHDPTATDWARRPKVGGNVNVAATADGIEERSIDFKQMIHRIHTGENLVSTQPFDIYGFNGSLNEFGDVRFPGDRTQCETCHVEGTYTVDAVPADAAWHVANETGTVMHSATAKHGAGETPIGPVQAACSGCHDEPAAKAHMGAMTYGNTETCEVCHGEDADFAVTKVHGTP